MHWFGEFMAFSVALILVVGIPAEVRYMRVLAFRLRNQRLDYTRAVSFQKSWRLLDSANASAIAALEQGQAPGFPEDIREQMLAAHEAASMITNERNRS